MDKNKIPKNIPLRPSRLLDTSTEDIKPEKEFEHIYKEAYKLVDEGITMITENRKEEGNQQLRTGLKLIDDALSIKIETFNVDPSQIQLYIEMQNKMRFTRKEVLEHFVDPQLNGKENSDDSLPSYDEYLQSLSNNGSAAKSSVSYPKLNPTDFQIQDTALEEIMNYSRSPLETPALSPQEGDMIFKIDDGVQIFFVYSNGRVTSPSHPSFLAISVFSNPLCSDESIGNPGARGFIQVGEWNYPLIPAQSPVLHSFYGAYMFPDPNNTEAGTSVGILIPDTGVDKDTRQMFEQILTQLTSFQEQVVPSGVNAEVEKTKVMEKSASVRISEGAEALSKGVLWGSEKLSELLNTGSEKLKSSIEPENVPRPVDPKWQTTAKVARNVSGTAVKVSGFVLNQLGKATLAIGKKVAPTIKKHSTFAVGRLTGQSIKDSSDQVDSVMEVASGAVKGASTIYLSLESAATTLAKSLSDNTVKVVSHKYGPEYGNLTDDSLHAVGQTVMVGHNVSALGVKGIAKRTAKDTGHALLSTYDKKQRKQSLQDEVMDGVEEAQEALEDSSSGKNTAKKL